jgi:glycosyltransferase involved in cell wall biosynthesis
MNVTTVIAEMGSGGAETIVAELTRGLLATDEVVVASSGGWRAAELERAGAQLLPLPLRDRRRVAASARLLHRYLAARRTDVIHAHNVKAALVARLATLRLCDRPPIVATLHGLAERDYPAAARILRACCGQLSGVTASVTCRIVDAGYPATRARVVENAITALRPREREVARVRLSVPAHVPAAVCVARLVAQKRHDLLIHAWQRVPAPAVLLIAGDGPTRPQLEELIHQTGQAGRIRLLGERRDVDWVLAAADLCVLPTDWEGLPVSLLEAMSLGLPVVASAVPELIATVSGAAELVPPGSVGHLAGAVRRVLDDPAFAARLGAAGRHLVQTRYGVTRMRDHYRRFYADALAIEGTAR